MGWRRGHGVHVVLFSKEEKSNHPRRPVSDISGDLVAAGKKTERIRTDRCTSCRTTAGMLCAGAFCPQAQRGCTCLWKVRGTAHLGTGRTPALRLSLSQGQDFTSIQPAAPTRTGHDGIPGQLLAITQAWPVTTFQLLPCCPRHTCTIAWLDVCVSLPQKYSLSDSDSRPSHENAGV